MPEQAETSARSIERLLTPEQVAAHLQVPVGTVRRWVTEGTIPSHRVGRRTRFTAGDVEAILDSTAVRAVTPIRNGASRRAAR